MTTSRTTTASASQARSGSEPVFRRVTRLALTLCTALTPVVALADTLPTGGQVVHGDVQIGAPGNGAMTITQGSDRAVVNWDAFSIGQGNRVDIRQPGSDAAILNRVTGDTTSQIHGQLNANGRVFVVNPNGIFIGPTGHVSAGGFVASTLNMRTDDFVTGQTVFEGNGASATVENAGTVEIVSGGYAALIGGKVRNSGTIQAPLGFVGLGAGERVTLDLSGDGFLQVAVPTETEDDGLEALIENSGTIQANGGTVQISAATARNAARHAVNLSGVVEARSVSGRNGRVTLGGGAGGKVTVSGKVRTRSRPVIQVTESLRPAPRPDRGGDITITGQTITLAGAEIDASGAGGGGNIRIGGDLQGTGDLPRADILTVDAGTTISADATDAGTGGRIILWSDKNTSFSGQISARGGASGGDGGFVEVSGKEILSYRGLADLRAPAGDWGTLLLDPSNVEIVASGAGQNQVLASDLVSQLALGDVTVATDGTGHEPATYSDLSEPGNISIDAPIVWTGVGSLFLNADNDITVNATISSTAGDVDMDAVNAISINAPILTTTGQVRAQSFYIDLDSDILTTSGEVILDANESVILGSAAPALVSTVSGDISLDALVFIDMYPGSALRSTSGEINVTSVGYAYTDEIFTNNDIFISGGSDMGSRSFDLSIVGPITSNNGNINIFTYNGIEIEGALTAPDGNLSIGIAGTTNDIDVSGPDAAVDVAEFDLSNGAWSQVEATLPAFDADNFILAGGSTFLRAEGGDGAGSPFQISDVYGLQGVGSFSTSPNVELVADIDASPTQTWLSPNPSFNGTRDAGFVPFDFEGIFEGNDHTITDLYIRTHGETPENRDAGLFDSLLGTVRNLSLLNVDIAGPNAGGVAAINDNTGEMSGSIEAVEVTGSITAYDGDGGGIVGRNFGSIIASRTDVSLSDGTDLSITDQGGPGILALGGIAGLNDSGATIRQTKSDSTIAASTFDGDVYVGGIAGENLGLVENSYVTGSTSAFTPDGATSYAGGISGSNFGTIINSLANGPVSVSGSGGPTGGIVGDDDDSDTSISSSYFNPQTTGQSTSGADGEVAADARSRTTAELRDADAFFLEANSSGWDFDLVWSFPQDGVDQARLYAVDPVISAFGESPPPIFQYNGSTTGFTAFGTYSGGPDIFEFGPTGDNADLTDMDDRIRLSQAGVGPVTYRFPTSFVSNEGQVYNVRSLDWPAQVTAAPLVISVVDVEKPYGTELDSSIVSLITETLQGSDSITSFTVTSSGGGATVPVSSESYDLYIDDVEGPGLENYFITLLPGQLRVVPRNVDVLIDSAEKVYGTEIAFSGTEFTVFDLLEGDTLTRLDIYSDGQFADAPVSDSPYLIEGENPVGRGLQNYVLNIIPGELTVTPAPLIITADDQTKPFGPELIFEGTEFTVTGLLNDDSVDRVTLSSEGAAPDAPFNTEGFAILISDPEGEGIENYEITFVEGLLVIAPGNLIITANDISKLYGTELTFDGTEFSVTGLAEGDSVTSVTLASAGTAATAQVAGSPYVITPSDPVGTGLDKYTLVFADGSLTVVPAPLTVTANDQFKQEGLGFTFAGTEFTVTGLVNDDRVDTAVLTSAGADAEATVDDSPYAIVVGDLTGSGLDNYDITRVDGSFTVGNIVTPPVVNPLPPGSNSLPNPPDRLNVSLPGRQTALGGVQGRATAGGTGGPQQSLSDAQQTYAFVDQASTELELAVKSCGSADQDFTNYMACLSESLDTYSNALDEIANDLPSGLETVSATIRTARDGVNAAAARAQRRLAGATSEAERRAIRRDAVNEARTAINGAQEEIRKAITLIRADDPEVAVVQRNTGARIIQALDVVDSELARAIEL